MKQKFLPCRTCRNKEGPKPGFYFETIPYGQSTSRVVVECECHKAWREENVFRVRAVRANVWPEARSYDPDTEYIGTGSLENVRRLKTYVSRFEEFGNVMVYMHGGNGTQKTTLAQWAAATLLSSGYTVQYMLMQNLLELLWKRKDFDDDMERDREVEKLTKIDLLVVDEAFSKEKVTLYKSGYQLPYLDRFLRDRVEVQRRGILFISNHPPEEIAQHGFSKSIEDLVVRKTRPQKSVLEFIDNYVKVASTTNIDIPGVFDR